MLLSRRSSTLGGPPGTRNRTALRARRTQRLRWFLWRWRVAIAAGAFTLAVALVVHEVRPAAEPTRPVLTVPSPIPAGQGLTSKDVTRTRVPVHLVPDDAVVTESEVTGRSAAVPLPRGIILTSSVLAGTDLSTLTPAGTVGVPVRLTDATVTRFLQVGDHVDLVQVPDQGEPAPGADETGQVDPAPERTRTLARRALVLPLPPTPEEPAGGLFDGPGLAEDDASFILVAVSPTEARLLTAAARSSYIGAVLVE